MSRTRSREDALTLIVGAVDMALCKYDAENVDVVENEQTGLAYVIYHSSNNSFAIAAGVVEMKHIDKNALVKELDDRSVGHCW